MNRRFQLILGATFWLAVVAFAYSATRPDEESDVTPQSSLTAYFSGPAEEIVIVDQSRSLRRHDPVFFQSPGDGSWRQVGFVTDTLGSANGDGKPEIRIAWHDANVPATKCRLVQYRNRGSLEDVIGTMLPPEKRKEIQNRIAEAMSAHGEELTAAFVPLVKKSLQESLPIIEDEFRRSVERHRDEIDSLAERWNDEVVAERLIPLARRQIMPIVRKHGQPPAEEIGRELWDRASLWRFGWRAVYDKTPLPRKDLVQGEWDRFVAKEAVPVFEAHMDDIVLAVQRIVTDVAANRTVRSELSEVADGLASDPAARELVRQVLKEAMVDNQRLRERWNEIWNSPDARRALTLAGDRLEPVVRGIGDDLFGTQEGGIEPNFARVLRNQILGKDRRWIIASLDEGSAKQQSIPVALASMPYPIVYMADQIVGAAADEGGGT